MIKVLLFGVLGDMCETSELQLENIADTNQLQDELYRQFPILKSKTYKIAVNQTVINDLTQLKNNDEVALLPPFAGG